MYIEVSKIKLPIFLMIYFYTSRSWLSTFFVTNSVAFWVLTQLAQELQVSFDSIASANTCLSSTDLHTMGLEAYIPSTLVYSFGIINLNISFLEEDFWEALESIAKIVTFRRITTNINGSPSPSRMVELRFLSPTLPENVAIYKVLFKVLPSIRSSVICQNCLHYEFP